MKKRLGDYIHEYSVRNKLDEDIPVYSVTNSQGFCRDYFSKDVASKDRTTYKIVPKGCFAYNPSRINVGSVDWQRNEERVIVSPLYNVFSVSSELDQQYLYYYLKSTATLYRIKNVATGSVRDNLRLSMLYDFMIELPEFDEQREIVKKLDLLSNLIQLRDSQLSALDELVKARFVEMFGEPRSNPSGFDKKPLKSTCKVITGNTPSRSESENYGDFIEWIKTDNIIAGLLNPTSAVEKLSEEGAKRGKIVHKGAILMACIAGSVASIGRVCVTDRTVAFNQQINAVIPEKYNVLFLYTLFQISKDYLIEEVNLSLKGILSKSKLENKEFIVPPLSLQNDFAAFVERVDQQKQSVQKSLEKLELMKKALMQEYFG